MKNNKFTHVDPVGNPQMVNVSEKKITLRVAKAKAVVKVGKAIISQIANHELMTKKGPVFQTAIIAGVMGAKKTAELIPLCHPLGLEDCKITITPRKDDIVIEGETTISAKTGVE